MRQLAFIIASVLLFTLPAAAGPYTVSGFRPFINLDGINVSYTYNPFADTAGNLKPEYVKAVEGLSPKGFRFMDWEQTVGSPIRSWTGRSVTDTGATGVTYETIVKTANRFKAVPWVTMPTMAVEDPTFAQQFGTLVGSRIDKTIPEIKFEYGNELWNGGDQLQGTYNLFRARADPRFSAYSDTEKMARLAWSEGFSQFKKFRAAVRAQGYTGKVTFQAPGFIANSYFAVWGLEQLKSEGVNVAAEGINLIVAPYVPGSPTDVTVTLGEGFQSASAKLKAFANQYTFPWFDQNKAVAAAYGVGIDVYEAAVMSNYTLGNAALAQQWKGYQYDPGMADLERWYIGENLKRGIGAYTVFGLVGPWELDPQYGQWALLPNPNVMTPKYEGVASLVDFAPVPEPSAAMLLAVGVLARRGRR
jgi:hypothetical protein